MKTKKEIVESITPNFNFQNEVVTYEWATMSIFLKEILSKDLASLMSQAVAIENYEMAIELRNCLEAKGINVEYDSDGEIVNVLPYN